MDAERTAVLTAAERCARIFQHLDQGDGVAALTAHLLDVEAMPPDDPSRGALLQVCHQAIALGERLERYQQKERALRDVFEIAQVLTELKDLDAVLLDIVVRARKLLRGDLAWLAGEEAGGVHVLAMDGAHTEAMRHMHGPATSGIAGYVARTRAAFTTQDYLHDAHFVHEPSIDAAIRAEGLQSVVAVPILSEAPVIGVVIVGDRYRRSYQPWEVSILATFAAQASVAIRNARTFELKQRALRDSEHANRQLEEKIAELQRSADAHDRLSRQLAQGGTLQDMLEVVSDLLQAQTSFLDPAGVELAAAPVATQGVAPAIATAASTERLRRVVAAAEKSRLFGRSVPVQTGAGHARVIAVSSGADHLGSLLIERATPLGEHDALIFERCSTAVGVLTLLAERRSASSRQEAELTLRTMVDAAHGQARDLIERARRHGLDPRGPLLLFVGELTRAKSSHVLKRIRERLRGSPLLAGELDGAVVALIQRADAAQIRADLETAIFQDPGVKGVACVSAALDGPQQLPAAFQSARRVLSLARKLGRHNRCLYEPELAMYAILFAQHERHGLEQLLEATIGPLLEHDARRGTRLAETLFTFLEHGQNACASADALGVHVNTVHNRLETIRGLLGDWGGGGRTAEVHLALRLHRLLEPPRWGVTPP